MRRCTRENVLGIAAAYRAAIERWENEGGRALSADEEILGEREAGEDDAAGRRDEHGGGAPE